MPCLSSAPCTSGDFDVRAGISRYDPRDRVTTYPVRQMNGQVEIDADAVQPIPTVEGYLKRWERHAEADVEPSIKQRRPGQTYAHPPRGRGLCLIGPYSVGEKSMYDVS